MRHTCANVVLPLFPLEIFLLPEGLTRLRVFEPRYIALVSAALKGDGFVLLHRKKAILNALADESPLNEYIMGSWVDIVNFDKDKNNVLTIDVKAKSLVKVSSVCDSKTQFISVFASPVLCWENKADQRVIKQSPENNDFSENFALAQSLKTLMKNNQALNVLYKGEALSDIRWVVSRWLELLPIDVDVKNHVINGMPFEQAKRFVYSIVQTGQNEQERQAK